MDTSEIFIRMADCPEIQGLRETKTGDYIARSNGTVYVYVEGGEFHIDSTWLPTQSQLQEIVEQWGIKGCWAQFVWAWHLSDDEYYGQFDSWEQLWLAFVMKEKYNKIWVDGWGTLREEE